MNFYTAWLIIKTNKFFKEEFSFKNKHLLPSFYILHGFRLITTTWTEARSEL